MTIEALRYSVPGVTCYHCRAAIVKEVDVVTGVQAVEVDLEQKLVNVRGVGLSDDDIRAAIDEAGYDIFELEGEAT
jgi:copper chaperone